MHSLPFPLLNKPIWQRQVRPRLAVGLGIGTLIVAAILSVFRLPVLQQTPFDPAIELQLLPATQPEPVESLPEFEPLPLPAARQREKLAVRSNESEEKSESRLALEPSPDWYAEIESAVKATLDAHEHVDSMNPVLDEKRRRAAVKYAPSRAPEKTPIWDNVEVDQLGRKILVSGSCYRVLDDPSAVNNEIFREFTQYLTYCSLHQPLPKEMPWVQDIRLRYAYLRYPDGEVPEEELQRIARMR